MACGCDVMLGATMIAIGLAIASFGQGLLGQANALYIGYGLFVGLTRRSRASTRRFMSMSAAGSTAAAARPWP